MADNWMLGETAALDDYIPNAPTNILGNAAQGVRDWYTNQPSWLDRAKAENQKTLEAYGRGGMGEIAKQLATDTTEPQELYGAFGVGNIKGVRPPVAPGALAATSEYRPPFYSAVEQAVQGAKQNAAPGQQWAGFLRNQPGVKQEEVQALGLGKLFEQPSVSKEAMLGEIAANRVNVGEVIKSERSQQPAAQRVNSIDDRLHDIQSEFDRLHQFDNSAASERRATLAAQERELRTERAGIVANWQERSSGDTKFSQYTLPGGENYREMLLTLPQKNADRLAQINDEMNRIAQRPAREHEATNELRDQWDRLNQERLKLQAKDEGPPFRSSHYDEPNVLAHVRYNDRVIDGKKTLFVEEVQSDWHQAGKRKGYRQQEATELPPGWRVEDTYLNGQRRSAVVADNGDYVAYGDTPAIATRNALSRTSAAGVPDAPFKTTWPELAMKRIIREAAEKGYDKVAWTPGSVQAARYDLSKQVNSIDVTTRSDARTGQPAGRAAYIKLPDGHALSVGVSPDGVIDNVGASNRDWKGKKLEDVIGKEMAEKIMKAKNGDTFTGLDLKVGGEGMKGFYDEILPATVNRLVKKHGGRVTQSEITKPEMKLSYEELQRRRSGEEPDPSQFKQPVHTIDITPSLRAAAMRGFPLFTAGGVAATGVISDLARQDEYR